jgi:hypothetical protein
MIRSIEIVVQAGQTLWKLMQLHAPVPPDEDANDWDDETRTSVKPLVKTE